MEVNQSNKGEKGIKDIRVWTQKIVESLDLELDDGIMIHLEADLMNPIQGRFYRR